MVTIPVKINMPSLYVAYYKYFMKNEHLHLGKTLYNMSKPVSGLRQFLFVFFLVVTFFLE